MTDENKERREWLQRISDRERAKIADELERQGRIILKHQSIFDETGLDRASQDERAAIIPMVRGWMFAQQVADKQHEVEAERSAQSNRLVVYISVIMAFLTAVQIIAGVLIHNAGGH